MGRRGRPWRRYCAPTVPGATAQGVGIVGRVIAVGGVLAAVAAGDGSDEARGVEPHQTGLRIVVLDGWPGRFIRD